MTPSAVTSWVPGQWFTTGAPWKGGEWIANRIQGKRKEFATLPNVPVDLGSIVLMFALSPTFVPNRKEQSYHGVEW